MNVCVLNGPDEVKTLIRAIFGAETFMNPIGYTHDPDISHHRITKALNLSETAPTDMVELLAYAEEHSPLVSQYNFPIIVIWELADPYHWYDSLAEWKDDIFHTIEFGTATLENAITKITAHDEFCIRQHALTSFKCDCERVCKGYCSELPLTRVEHNKIK